MRKICQRCGNIFKKANSLNYCDDCKRELEDNNDIEELTDDGWKEYY